MGSRQQTRRDFVLLAGTVGVVGLAGCAGRDQPESDTDPVIERDVQQMTDVPTTEAPERFDVRLPSLWPMAQATAAHTGYAPVAGPTTKDVRWEQTLPGEVLSGVAASADSVYVTTSKKRLFALSMRNGTVRWNRKFERDLPYTPACVGDLVLVSVHKTALVALSAATGESVWTATVGRGPVTAPTVHGRTVTFGAADDVVYVLDVEDGSTVADSVPFPLGGLQTVTVEDDRFYVGAVSGVYAMDGRCVRVWSRSLTDAVRGPPVLVDDRLFVAGNGGSILALDKQTGKVTWTVDLEAGIHGPLSANDESLFVVAGKDVYCLEQDSGEVRWVQRVGATSATGLALGADALYLGTFDQMVYALNVVDGDDLWRYEAELPVHAAPALVSGQLYIGDNAGTVRAFG